MVPFFLLVLFVFIRISGRHQMMDAIQAIDGKNEPLVKQPLAKMDQLDEEVRKISELQFRRYDLEREVRIAEPVRAEAFAEWKQARAISLALTSLDNRRRPTPPAGPLWTRRA